MTDIASLFRAEISRIARKEIRAEILSLKKALTQQRSAVAQLKRQASELEKKLRQASRTAVATSSTSARTDSGVGDTPRRFSATRLASHRAKLGISAAAYGKLVGMSGATIYLWEQGKSRPSAEQLQRLAAVRSMGKRGFGAFTRLIRGAQPRNRQNFQKERLPRGSSRGAPRVVALPKRRRTSRSCSCAGPRASVCPRSANRRN